VQNTDDWRSGRRSLRDRLYGVVLIPGIALLVLWAATGGATVYNGLHLRSIATGVRDVSLPAMRVLASAQKERTLSLLETTAPGATGARLSRQREATDRAVAGMRATAEPALDDAPDGVRQRMTALDELIGRLPAVRAQVDAHRLDRAGIHGYYDAVVDSGSALFEAQARLFPDAAVSRGALQATEFFRAADRMARAASLATDGLRSGSFPAADHLAFTRLTGAYHLDLDSAGSGAAPPVRAQLARVSASPHFAHLAELEGRIVARGPWSPGGGPEVDVADWLTTADLVADDLTSLSAAQAQRTAADGLETGNRTLAQVAIAGVVALAVVLAAILVALRVSRRLSRRLQGLRDDALLITDGQLPEIVARLRRGEAVDLSGEVARLDYGRDEIGQVAEAFNTAQRTAIAAAVRETQAREGVNHVFLGIAGRSQALVHRLLTMIDRLEREETDPDRMQLLFGLDHLATRARRNAENLIILGGGESGRRWSRPIELADVLRSAVAETKHYARVRVQKPPELALHGDAVADAVHLVAELLDNATSFSPPESAVGLHSRTAAGGVVVEVEDRGLGMAEADREAANAMLADPPEFDAMALRSDSRLGLFVVARLAARHGIGVELQESAHGGTKAVVLLPQALIVEPVEQESDTETTARLPRVRSAAGEAPEEPVEQSAEPPVLDSSAAWADPEQWPAEDPPDAEAAESAEDLPWPDDPDEDPADEPADESRAGRHSVDGPTDPTARTQPPEKPRTSTQPFGPATDSGENTPTAEPARTRSSDVTPSADDWPTTHSYRSGSGHPPDGPRAEHGTSEPELAEWPTEDPADPIPAESPEETTDESVAWPQETAATDPTGTAPPGPDQPAEPAGPGAEAPEPDPVPLPRRRRLAHLAPELVRDEDGDDEPARTDAAARSPEEARDVMSAIRRGTDRGRKADPGGSG